MANQLIQKLLDAEQEADAIVRRAKENWVKRVKDAQSSAEEDIKRFRAAEEEKFQQEYAQVVESSTLNDNLEEKTKQDIEEVKHQFRKNRDGAMALLISSVVKVDLGISEVEKRQIQLHFAQKAH